MPVIAKLHHITRYTYAKPVRLGPHILRLRPAPHCRQPILDYQLKIEPDNHRLTWYQDPHSNWLARAIFFDASDTLTIRVTCTLDMAAINPFDFLIDDEATLYPFRYSDDLTRDLIAYRAHEPCGPRLAAFTAPMQHQTMSTIDCLVHLNQRIHSAITYIKRKEAGVQNPEETLRLQSGSCRDSTWLFIISARHLGFAARFVSGYLIDVGSSDAPAHHDESELHAWAEVYLPGAGWIGFDTTSGLLCNECHLPLAAAPHYASAAPVTGTTEPVSAELRFDMRVERLNADANDEAALRKGTD
jgi:transglutaminase-like putative cysteine protease